MGTTQLIFNRGTRQDEEEISQLGKWWEAYELNFTLVKYLIPTEQNFQLDSAFWDQWTLELAFKLLV